MPRFIQENNRPQPVSKDKPRVLPTKGTYTMEQLTAIKPIITPNGGKR